MTHDAPDETYELLRSCPAVPLGQDGAEQEPSEMPPGMQLRIVEQRDGRLVVESTGGTPTSRWCYLVTRPDFQRAITPPEVLPREGQAPTSQMSTGGGPD